MDLKSRFKKISGNYAVLQTPNAPIIGWAIFLVLAHLLSAGRWELAASYISFGFLFTWAWLEITQGANNFRRLLGAAVIVFSIYSRIY